MYRVIIVDDEVLARIGLRVLLDWGQEGFEIVGEASNGKEGAELILENSPDLVIADIDMPVMDGLEMFGEVKKQGLDPVFVFLSSYDQFDLVKKAMKMGALDYLLKLSIKPETLKDMLDAVKVVLKEKEGDGKESREMSLWEKEKLQKAYLESLVEGRQPEIAPDQLGISLDTNNLRLCYVVSDMERIARKKKDAENRNYIETIRALIEEICAEFCVSHCIYQNYSYIILLSGQKADAESEEMIRSMAEAILMSLKEYGNVEASIGISPHIKELGHIADALETVKQIRTDLPTVGFGKVYFYQDTISVSRKSAETAEVSEMLETEKLNVACRKKDYALFLSVEKTLSEQILGCRISLEEAKYHSNRYVLLTEEYLKKADYDWFETMGISDVFRDAFQNIHQSRTLQEIVRCNHSFVDALKDFFGETQRLEANHIVRDAKAYIRKHIYENIGLKEISAALYINPSYLSAVFSKEESCGLANYINQMKVKEAKRMLSEERIRIGDVSQRLGYENASYFAKVFRRYTNMSPKEYIDSLK